MNFNLSFIILSEGTLFKCLHMPMLMSIKATASHQAMTKWPKVTRAAQDYSQLGPNQWQLQAWPWMSCWI